MAATARLRHIPVRTLCWDYTGTCSAPSWQPCYAVAVMSLPVQYSCKVLVLHVEDHRMRCPVWNAVELHHALWQRIVVVFQMQTKRHTT